MQTLCIVIIKDKYYLYKCQNNIVETCLRNVKQKIEEILLKIVQKTCLDIPSLR